MIRKTRVSPNRIILAMDSHGLNYAQQCDKKYWFAHVEHLKSRKRKKAFEVGTFIHDLIHRVNRLKLRQRDGRIPFGKVITLTDFIAIGMKRIARRKEFSQEEKLQHQSKWMEFLAMHEARYTWLKPMGSEVGFSKVIYEDSDTCFIYEGRIDHIARPEPANYLSWIDWKSQSRDYVLYKNPNQFIGYSWALGTNMGFVGYYGLQKSHEKEKAFRLEPIYHPPELISQWKHETIKAFRTVAALAPFGELAFERKRSACTAGFTGRCQYIELCDNAWAPKEVLVGLKRMLYKIEPWHPWRSKEEIEETTD